MHPPQQLPIGNRLLVSLSADDFASLQPHLEPISLETRQVLIEPDTRIEHAYFPEFGMSSVTNNSASGKIEVGVVGREGGRRPPDCAGDRSDAIRILHADAGSRLAHRHSRFGAGHGPESVPAPPAPALCPGGACSGVGNGLRQCQQRCRGTSGTLAYDVSRPGEAGGVGGRCLRSLGGGPHPCHAVGRALVIEPPKAEFSIAWP